MNFPPLNALTHRGSNWCSAIFLGLALALGNAAVQASPTPLLTVSDTDTLSASGHLIRPDQAAAVSFIFDNAFSNVTITADLTRLASAVEGGVYLVRLLGPDADTDDLVAAVDFKSINFTGAGTVLFTGLNLIVGSYAVVVANGQANPVGAVVVWNGSSTADVAQSAGVVDGIDFFSADTSGFLFDSFFSPVSAERTQAFFSVTANEVTSVPEPGSLLLVFLAMGSLVWVRVQRPSLARVRVRR